MNKPEVTTLKHFSWVPVSFITFIYNRDLIKAVQQKDITVTGLLHTLYAFTSSNWQTVKRFKGSEYAIPKPDVLIKVILSIAEGDQTNTDFYNTIYWSLKSNIDTMGDRIARREQIIQELTGNPISGSLDALVLLKRHNAIRAAVEVIDEMFNRDGTYAQHDTKSRKLPKDHRVA